MPGNPRRTGPKWEEISPNGKGIEPGPYTTLPDQVKKDLE